MTGGLTLGSSCLVVKGLMVAGSLESDTCRDYIVPALRAAGWSDRQIVEQHFFTDGRVIPTSRGHRRKKGLRADYVLEMEPGLPIGVVEAKGLYKKPGDGLQQGMRYAEILDLPFAYSSNGKAIVEHAYDTGTRNVRSGSTSPTGTSSTVRSSATFSGTSVCAVTSTLGSSRARSSLARWTALRARASTGC